MLLFEFLLKIIRDSSVNKFKVTVQVISMNLRKKSILSKRDSSPQNEYWVQNDVFIEILARGHSEALAEESQKL